MESFLNYLQTTYKDNPLVIIRIRSNPILHCIKIYFRVNIINFSLLILIFHKTKLNLVDSKCYFPFCYNSLNIIPYFPFLVNESLVTREVLNGTTDYTFTVSPLTVHLNHLLFNRKKKKNKYQLFHSTQKITEFSYIQSKLGNFNLTCL